MKVFLGLIFSYFFHYVTLCQKKTCITLLFIPQHFTSQREDFEGTREAILVWLTEMDLQLTNVEHFSESDVHDKMRQLNVSINHCSLLCLVPMYVLQPSLSVCHAYVQMTCRIHYCSLDICPSDNVVSPYSRRSFAVAIKSSHNMTTIRRLSLTFPYNIHGHLFLTEQLDFTDRA